MTNRRQTLLCGTLFAAAAAVAGLSASTARAAESEAVATAGATNQTEVEGLVVTGSRIARPNLDQPTPVEIVSKLRLENSGSTNLGNVIAQLPALGAAGTERSNSNSFGTIGGLNFADLRNLGTGRTLVLVNGKRHVAGDPSSAAVDLSSIPPALVDHVEIVTGGASAIYGSDALAGVVNVILKKNFVGVEGDFQAGVFTPGGFGRDYSANITAGANFAQDRGNIAVTLLWDKSSGVVAHDIRSLNNYGTIVNPFYTDGVPIPNDGIPDRLLVPNVISEFIDENSVLLDVNSFQPITAFTNAGAPVPQQHRIADNSFAFGQFAGPCPTCFAFEDYQVIAPRTQRYGGAVNLYYDLTPNIRFTLDAKYISNTARDFVQPSFTFGDFQLQPDNAFITPAIATLLTGLDPADYPLIARFMSDFGNRANVNKRETYRIVGGLNGKFDAGFADVTWDTSFNYGTTRNHITETGTRISGNFEAALDSVIDPGTGQPACRINVPSAQPDGFTPPDGVLNGASCVPYNPFGQQNTAAAAAYSTVTIHEFQALEQKVADLNVTFDTSRFFNLPGGPLAFAAGAEWRREHSVDIQDPLIIAGLTENAPTPNASGGFSVYEGYLEMNAPILAHRPFAEELSIDGAVRLSHYSTVGSTNAWKFSGVYAPIPDIKFRATYSRAVRAPNITEAFLPASGTFFTVTDPCSAENIDANVNRRANCIAENPIFADFTAQTNESPPGTVSGNPHLTTEQSESYTVGAVVRPRFLPEVSVTVDYYNIKINDAISLIDAQDILDNCYDSSAGLDTSFCGKFTRGADHNIDFITSTYINSAALKTEGIEVQGAFTTDVDRYTQNWGGLSKLNGKLTASIDFNYLMKLRNFPFQADPTQVHILERNIGTPKVRFLTDLNYQQGPWSFNWQTRYVGRSVRFNQDPTQADFAESISPAYVGAQWYNNFVVRYRLEVAKGQVELYVGANDIFDVQPPIGVIAGNSTGPDGSSLYDLGRYVFGGVRAKF